MLNSFSFFHFQTKLLLHFYYPDRQDQELLFSRHLYLQAVGEFPGGQGLSQDL